MSTARIPDGTPLGLAQVGQDRRRLLCGGIRFGLRDRLIRHAPGCPESTDDTSEWTYRGNALGWASPECQGSWPQTDHSAARGQL